MPKDTKDFIEGVMEEFDEEFGHVVFKNSITAKYAVDFLRTALASAIQHERERVVMVLEEIRKRMDVGDFGVDSVSFPSGEIWTQKNRQVHNNALDAAIKEIKK